jgi:hypothetical protein
LAQKCMAGFCVANLLFLNMRVSYFSGEVAKLFADAGLICIASLISPYRSDRSGCRNLLHSSSFIEVYIVKLQNYIKPSTQCFSKITATEKYISVGVSQCPT